ncbi:MAG: RING finger protein [Candidatus Jordarchaeaceae archaeon]
MREGNPDPNGRGEREDSPIITGKISGITIEKGSPQGFGRKRGKITVQSGENWQILNFEGYTCDLSELIGHQAEVKIRTTGEKMGLIETIKDLDRGEIYRILDRSWDRLSGEWLFVLIMSLAPILLLLIGVLLFLGASLLPLVIALAIAIMVTFLIALHLEVSTMKSECRQVEKVEEEEEKPEIRLVFTEPQTEEVEEERDECPICRKVLLEGDKTEVCPNCLERFHRDHLLEWVKVKGTCPNCGQRIVLEKKRRRGGRPHYWFWHYGEPGFFYGDGMDW